MPKEILPEVITEHIPAIPGANPKLSLNDSPESLLKKLDEWCTGFARVTETGDRVLFFIAKILVAIRDTEAYRLKHESFTAFVREEVEIRHRISHGAIWKYIGACTTLPGLTGAKVSRIGIEKLVVASRVVKKVGMSRTDIERMLREAEKTKTIEDFQDAYPQGEDGRKPGYRVIRIPTTVTVARSWARWIGKRDPGSVLKWVMDKHPELPQF